MIPKLPGPTPNSGELIKPDIACDQYSGREPDGLLRTVEKRKIYARATVKPTTDMSR